MAALKSNRYNKTHTINGLAFIIAVFAMLFIVFNIILKGQFLAWNNFSVILSHAVIPLLISLGICFIFSCNLIDLSIGANVMLSANVGAILAIDFQLGYPGLILGSIICAACLELLSIKCCLFLEIPSWVNGLGFAMIYEAALSAYVSSGKQTTFIGGLYQEIATMPLIVIIGIAGVVVAYVCYQHTDIGINMRAIGTNAQVAEKMGIKKNRSIYLSCLVGGIFIGIAAAVQMSYSVKINATTGLGSISYMFTPLAIWLLSDAIERWVMMPVGMAIGAVFIAGLFNFMSFMGIPSGTGQNIVLGLVVIFFGVISKRNYKGIVK